MTNYPKNVGSKAPEAVQSAIKQYFQLPEAEQLKTPLLYWLLGSSTPPYKLSKEDANYTDKSTSKAECGNCEYIYQNISNGELYICSQIAGEIKPEGVCNRWKLSKSLKDKE